MAPSSPQGRPISGGVVLSLGGGSGPCHGGDDAEHRPQRRRSLHTAMARRRLPDMLRHAVLARLENRIAL